MNPEIIEHKVTRSHLTAFEVPEFRKELVSIARQAPRGILIDMTLVESLDSASVGVIILLARLLPRPARVCLYGVRPEIRTLCRTLRVNSVLGLADTRAEAIEHIEGYLARKAGLTDPSEPSTGHPASR